MIRRRTLASSILIAALTWGTSAWAVPGDLDATFNGTGSVVTTVLGGGRANAVVRQSDGKVVVAGSAMNGSRRDIVVVRYDANGTLDPTFGGGTGKVSTTVGTGEDEVKAVIQQTDGKLVVAGSSLDAGFNSSTITLVRYQDDGTLDPGFGGGTGKVTTTVGPDFDAGSALIQQSDLKLVVAGYSGTDLVVVRYLIGGGLDTSFNGTGVVITTVGTQVGTTANAVLQQGGDDKLVVAGSADTDIVVVRYGTTGTLDATFGGGDGIVTTSVGSSAEARAIVQQAGDDKLVVAGVSNNGTDDDITLVRYDSAGSPDPGFGSAGVVTTGIGVGADQANAIAQQADGLLVVAGSSRNGANLDFALVRYDATGAPDPGFGTSGHVETPIGTGDDEALALLVQPNGGLVAAGYAKSGSVESFAVARYLSLSGTTTSTVTTTSSTSMPVTTTTSTTSTTLPTQPAALVPGGPSTKTSSDCYLELRVEGIDAATQVQKHQVVLCTDGDPCDASACGDARCQVRIAACSSQSDPQLADCSPPASLDTVKLSGALAGSTGGLLAGPACTSPVTVLVPIKLNRKGAYLAGKSKVVVKGKAKAAKGTSPRTDGDKWTIQCLPRVGDCPN